jgi:cell division protein ZapA (FtsZ GTPase activity inhibitor)
MTVDVTVRLDAALLSDVRAIAVKRKVSLTALVTDCLQSLVRYEEAKRRVLARRARPTDRRNAR